MKTIRSALLAGAALLSCTDPIAPDPVSCSSDGTLAADVPDSATWRTADGPHVIADSVIVRGKLVIEPGALVCGRPGAKLLLTPGATLLASGSARDTIVFTAVDSLMPWAGIQGTDDNDITLRFARLERANIGLLGLGLGRIGSSRLLVEDTHVAFIEDIGLDIGTGAVVRRTTIRDAGTAVNVGRGGAELRDVLIQRPGLGIRVNRTLVQLHDVTVEDSRGMGISLRGISGGISATNLVVTRSMGIGINVEPQTIGIENCEVSDGSTTGIRLGYSFQSGRIRNCNIVRNAGPGVHNTSSYTIDASLNWWGDPAGPGNGVQGALIVEPVLTTPANLGGG